MPQSADDFLGASAAPHAEDFLGPDPNAPIPSMDKPLANNPFAGGGFWHNALLGAGQGAYNLGTGAEQLYARATGNQSMLERLQAQQASDRQLTAPLDQTAGGKVGQALGTAAASAPAMLIPGAQGILGGAILGGVLGGLQPTETGQSGYTPLINAGVGAAGGAAGAIGGKLLGRWALGPEGKGFLGRANQPFMGYTQSNLNRVAAESVGEEAPELSQPVINEAFEHIGNVLKAGQDPSVSVPLGQSSLDAIIKSGRQFGSKALDSQPEVEELVNYASKGGANAQELGDLADRLRIAAQSEVGTKTGDKALGNALYGVREHVLDQIQNSIQDPEIAAAYAQARPQYRNLLTLTGRTSILKSASGEFNPTNLGNYLQRADRYGFTRGNNTSPLYEAARWGQSTGAPAAGIPEFSLENPIPFLKGLALRNPLTRAIGGVGSRAIAPAAPYLSSGFAGLGAGAGTQLQDFFDEH